MTPTSSSDRAEAVAEFLLEEFLVLGKKPIRLAYHLSELDFAHHRQLFLTEQGYSYEILDETDLMEPGLVRTGARA